MKKIMLFLTAATVFLAACNNSSTVDTATTSTQPIQTIGGKVYKIDSTTLVTWIATKPTGNHEGTFKVTEGSLIANSNTLTGGSFTIDINSLNNTDMVADADNKGKLEGHLKSADFFDASKYPTAKFEITSVEPFIADINNKEVKLKDANILIKGNLTLKDSTKNISFPAKVTADDSKITASADFYIDRTLWGLNYKGPNNPKDWVINKEVNMKLSIIANKK